MLERTHGQNDDLSRYLAVMVQHGASDLFLSSGTPAGIKVQGTLRRLDEPALDGSQTQALAYSIMRESQIKSFEATLECDFAIALPGLGRFRVNVYRQRGEVAVVRSTWMTCTAAWPTPPWSTATYATTPWPPTS